MTLQVLLATRNAGKVLEMQRLLEESGLDIDIVGTDTFPDLEDVEETGATFVENALLKAHAGAQGSGLPTIADDSGLCVAALNEMPGIYSARWSGTHGDDEANLRLLLAQISHVPHERRHAHFACAAALVFPDGREYVVEGRMEGSIVDAPRGSGGFGYDPIFVAEGDTRTSAELSPAEKDAISHRGKAMRSLVELMRDLFA
jgi:XTP/dITP diphosphohydrolase